MWEPKHGITPISLFDFNVTRIAISYCSQSSAIDTRVLGRIFEAILATEMLSQKVVGRSG